MKTNKIIDYIKRLTTAKILTASVACGLIVSVMLALTAFSGRCDGIRGNVLRLHIIANSDTDDDQALKLQVRDRLLTEGNLILSDVQNEKEAESEMSSKLALLQKSAEDEIADRGYDYPVSVTLCRDDFGTRVYDEVTLPAGQYNALKVVIGSGSGHNWWCVMFPPMCIPCAGEREELSDVLSDGQLEVTENSSKYKVEFKLAEYYEAAVSKLSEWF